jgi:hypothetical protein
MFSPYRSFVPNSALEYPQFDPEAPQGSIAGFWFLPLAPNSQNPTERLEEPGRATSPIIGFQRAKMALFSVIVPTDSAPRRYISTVYGIGRLHDKTRH